MPKQSKDIYSPTTPAIVYSKPGQTWTITKQADVGGEGVVTLWSWFNKSTLVNKGYLYSYETTAAYFTGNNAEIVNEESGHINGGVNGVQITGPGVTYASLMNDGKIFGGSFGVRVEGPGDFEAENHGEIYGYTCGMLSAGVTPGSTAGPKIVNHGSIESESYGIYTQAAAGLRTKLVNGKDGLISGGKLADSGTAAVYNPGGKLNLENEGKIKGDVAIINPGRDSVTNKGVIKGHVYLGDGDDTFKSKGGKAGKLHGLEGDDKFVLDSSKDKIVFETPLGPTSNVDRIKNFESDKDKFFLDATFAFTGLAPGALPGSAFEKGTESDDATDRIIYEKSTGRLFYDPDGNGLMGQEQFAQLDPGTKLKATDFEVFV